MAVKSFPAGCVDRGGGNGKSSNGESKGGGLASGYASTDIAGIVIYPQWADLQPTKKASLAASYGQALTGQADPAGTRGGASGWWSTGTALINYAANWCNTNGLFLVVRIGCGIYSPSWLTDGSFGRTAGFAYQDPSSPANGTCPVWWDAGYIDAYTSLISLFQASYDNSTGNNASIASTTFSGGMTAYQECLLRGTGAGTNNVQLMVEAGYYLGAGSYTTVGSDQYALFQMLSAHQVLTETFTDIAFNPYQYIYCGPNPNNQVYSGPVTSWQGVYNAGTTYAYGAGVYVASGANAGVYVSLQAGNVGNAVTNTNWWGAVNTSANDSAGFDVNFMGQARSLLAVTGGGNLAILGNNSYRLAYSFTGGSSPYDVMYAALAKKAPGLKIQTATDSKLGTSPTGTPLTDILDQCVAAGVNFVELPGGYNNETGSTGNNPNNDYLPPGTPGNTGSGGDASHGAAYYTTKMQALAQPQFPGGGAVGIGQEYPASTSGPGIA